MSDNRPNVYQDEDTWVYRASSFGGCTRGLVAARMGVPAQPIEGKAKGWMEEGDLHEGNVLERLANDGYEIVATQEEVELEFGHLGVVRGHTDGTIRHGTAGITQMLEIKSRSQDQYKKWLSQGIEGFPQMKWQVSAYMLATGLPCLVATKNRNTGELDRMVIATPPYALTDFLERIQLITMLAEAEEYPVCDVSQFPCPYVAIHAETEGPERLDDAVLALVLSKYMEAKRRRDEIEAEVSDLRQKIMDVVGAGDKVTVGDWNVHVVAQMRRDIDIKQLRQDLGEEVERWTVEKMVPQLRVTPLKSAPARSDRP